MSENLCPQCGAPLPAGTTQCKYCGEEIRPQPQPVQSPPQNTYQQPAYQQNPYQQPAYQQPMYQQPELQNQGINPTWPIKSKIAAGLLAIFLGGLGIHKFYLGKVGLGIVYLLFCWTWIPGIIGLIEGIIYLCTDDYKFQIKHQVRLQ